MVHSKILGYSGTFVGEILVNSCDCNKNSTSRDRPKSAPYLRLKKTRKLVCLQLEKTKALKKLKIEKKIRFFSIFFEVSGKSHSAEKCKRGALWDFLNMHSVAKYQKLMGEQ